MGKFQWYVKHSQLVKIHESSERFPLQMFYCMWYIRMYKIAFHMHILYRVYFRGGGGAFAPLGFGLPFFGILFWQWIIPHSKLNKSYLHHNQNYCITVQCIAVIVLIHICTIIRMANKKLNFSRGQTFKISHLARHFACKICWDSISEHLFFKNFLGGMPPDPLALASYTCWLCFTQLHTQLSTIQNTTL